MIRYNREKLSDAIFNITIEEGTSSIRLDNAKYKIMVCYVQEIPQKYRTSFIKLQDELSRNKIMTDERASHYIKLLIDIIDEL